MEYSVRTSTKHSVIFGGLFALTGILLLIFLNIYLGALFFLLGIIFFLYMRYFGNDTTVTCHDTGFSIKVVNKRKGTTITEYNWEDVTETLFYVHESGSGDNQSTTYHFRVTTHEGVAFNLIQTKGFAHLIETFNQHTPHLPYYWTKPKGFLSAPFKKVNRN